MFMKLMSYHINWMKTEKDLKVNIKDCISTYQFDLDNNDNSKKQAFEFHKSFISHIKSKIKEFYGVNIAVNNGTGHNRQLAQNSNRSKIK